jgi:hypothetical protein
VSELIERLTGLEERLAREQIDLLLAMAKQPGERPLAAADLSQVSNIHSALEAVCRSPIETSPASPIEMSRSSVCLRLVGVVKAEIAARHTREGVSF